MKRKRYLLILILLTLGWMTLIFGFSAQTGEESGGLSAYISQPVTNVIAAAKNLPADAIDTLYLQVDNVVRKAAHFCEYAVLGGLLALVCRKLGLIRLCFPWLIGTLYAVLDEWHQAYSPGRACDFRDVLIDSLGVLCGICLTCLSMKLWRKENVHDK